MTESLSGTSTIADTEPPWGSPAQNAADAEGSDEAHSTKAEKQSRGSLTARQRPKRDSVVMEMGAITHT